jgi:hypothetical protein
VKAKKRISKGCPFCGGFRVAKENSLKAKCPEVAKLWDKSRNLALLPKQVTYMSNKKVFWRCDKNPDHAWEAKVCYMATRWNKEGIVCQFCKSAAKGKV